MKNFLFVGCCLINLLFPLPSYASLNTDGAVFSDYPKLTALPKNFLGLDAEQVYSSLAKLPHEKSQYQTDADVKNETRDLAEKDTVLQPLVTGYIVLTAPAGEGGFNDIFYDAEQGRFFFNYPWRIIPVLNQEKSIGMMKGTTPLGVQIDYEQTEVNRVSLILANMKSLPFKERTGRPKKYKVSKQALDMLLPMPKQPYSSFCFGSDEIIKMASSHAKAHDGKIRFGYVVKLEPPYIIPDDTFVTKASIQNPMQTVITVHGIAARLEGMLIYNGETGEILFQRSFTKASK